MRLEALLGDGVYLTVQSTTTSFETPLNQVPEQYQQVVLKYAVNVLALNRPIPADLQQFFSFDTTDAEFYVSREDFRELLTRNMHECYPDNMLGALSHPATLGILPRTVRISERRSIGVSGPRHEMVSITEVEVTYKVSARVQYLGTVGAAGDAPEERALLRTHGQLREQRLGSIGAVHAGVAGTTPQTL